MASTSPLSMGHPSYLLISSPLLAYSLMCLSVQLTCQLVNPVLSIPSHPLALPFPLHYFQSRRPQNFPLAVFSLFSPLMPYFSLLHSFLPASKSPAYSMISPYPSALPIHPPFFHSRNISLFLTATHNLNDCYHIHLISLSFNHHARQSYNFYPFLSYSLILQYSIPSIFHFWHGWSISSTSLPLPAYTLLGTYIYSTHPPISSNLIHTQFSTYIFLVPSAIPDPPFLYHPPPLSSPLLSHLTLLCTLSISQPAVPLHFQFAKIDILRWIIPERPSKQH